MTRFSPLHHGEPCMLMQKIERPDGLGGQKTEYKEDTSFRALIETTSAPYLKRAEQNHPTAHYRVSVPLDIKLKPNDIFRREADGQLFRVTTNPLDATVPKQSRMAFASIEAVLYYEPRGGRIL